MNNSSFRLRPLTNALPQEVGQVAIDYTLARADRFPIESGIPKVVLSRPITLAELPSIGFDKVSFLGEEPPMMLVVVKANFDLSGFIEQVSGEPPRPTQRTKFKYIAYVFDLRAGLPSFTTSDLTGEYFRHALNDPSIPDKPKPIKPKPGMPEAVPAPPQPTFKKVPYGSIVNPDGTVVTPYGTGLKLELDTQHPSQP